MIDLIRGLAETTDLPEVPRERVRYLVDIAIGAFGQAFFSQPRMEKSPILHALRPAHTLLRFGNQTGGKELALSAFAEVGLYLEAFADDPRIKECLDGLREDFESRLFQLAVAFRLRAAGASGVVLEPDTARGRADVAFDHCGAHYVAECYRINKTFFDYFVEAQLEFVRGVYDLLPESKRFSVTVSFGLPPTFDTFRRTLRVLSEMRDELAVRPDVIQLSRRVDQNRLGLEDITEAENDPDLEVPDSGPPKRKRYHDAEVMHLRESVQAGSLSEAADSSYKSRTYGTRVFLWKRFDGVPKKLPHEILLGRLNAKLKQAKPLQAGAFRILFVEYPSGLFGPFRQPRALAEISQRAARHFEDVAGIWVIERLPWAVNRFQYHGVLLPVSTHAEHLKPLADRLSIVEQANFFALAL